MLVVIPKHIRPNGPGLPRTHGTLICCDCGIYTLVSSGIYLWVCFCLCVPERRIKGHKDHEHTSCMVPDDVSISVDEIVQLQSKGDNMTLREKSYLDEMYKELARASCVEKNGKRVNLTLEQMQFVAHLPYLVRQRVPKLDDMMRLFGLNVNDVLVSVYDFDDYLHNPI